MQALVDGHKTIVRIMEFEKVSTTRKTAACVLSTTQLKPMFLKSIVHFGDAIRCKLFQKEPTLTEKGPYIPPQECKRAHIFQIFTAVEEDGNVYISGMATIKLKGFIGSILLQIWQQSVYLPF